MEALVQDIRFGVRMLVKNPLVTLVAVITLALGIGANTAIFSAVNAFLLRLLPVQNASRLTVLGGQVKGQDAYGGVTHLSYLDYRDLRERAQGFSSLLAYDLNLAGLESDGKVDPVIINYVSSNYFSSLGLKPAQGRLIYGDETEQHGAAPVIVLSHEYWKNRFGSDTAVLGKQLKVNGRSATVIGVAPQGFRGLYSVLSTDVFLPMGMNSVGDDNNDPLKARGPGGLRVLGLLAPGISRKEAQSSLDVVMKRLASTYPEDKDLTLKLYPEWLARPEPNPSSATLILGILFMSLAGLVLLLACTNVANIILVRATGRTREMAVRAALGAARTRLIRQLLTESLLLGLLGGAAGLMLGSWISKLLSSIHMMAMGHELVLDLSFDWRVFAFGSGAALVTGIVVGLAPAWRASRTDVNQVLHQGSRGVVAGTNRGWARHALVVGQVAGSLTLLIVAGLFVRSTRNAESMYFGFDPSHLLNLTMDTDNVGFDKARAHQFYRDLEDKVRVLPGVQNVALASSVPMGYNGSATQVFVEAKTAADKQSAPVIIFNRVSQDYFATMRVPLLRGRLFNSQDKDGSPRVAIVNEAMARRFWPNEDPIGKTFRKLDSSGPVLQIVGVAKQGKYLSPVDEAISFFYVPDDQDPATLRTLQIRVAGVPEALIPEVEREIHALAPGMPLVDVESMGESLEGANGLFLFRMGERFATALGLLGLALALVGVYGVISYAAAQRTHEIGVRMALGADRADILMMVLRQGVILVGGGVLFGLLAAFALTRVIGNFLVGVSPSDPLTFSLVAVFLGSVGLLASYIPARRAMNVEPLRALKYE
jgi:predicted permease